MACYVDPKNSAKLLNEEVFFNQTSICIKEAATETKVDHLEIQITSHKMWLFHGINKVFNFEFQYDKIQNFKIEKRGMFSKMIYKIGITYGGKEYGVKLMDRGNFESAAQKFEQAFKNKTVWNVKRYQPIMNNTSGFLSRYRFISLTSCRRESQSTGTRGYARCHFYEF